MSDSKTRGRGSNLYECESELRRGPWTLEEDNLLSHYISCHGEGRWNSLAKFAGLKRTGKSCRLRWLNYLKPDIKRGDLTPHEQLLILELHSKWGNKWSKIAQHLPGRTDNEIKNYWRTRVQKQARQLKVDCNSKTFIEAIRTFWMPRLFEQMEQNLNHASSISTVNPSSVKTNSDSHSSNSAAQAAAVDLTTGKIPTAEQTAYYDEGIGFPYDMQDWDDHDRHVVGIDWFGEDFTFSNTDELWQFNNL